MAKNSKNALSTDREQQIDYLAVYGKEATRQSNIVGKLLRFTKGEFLAGPDDEIIQVGTKVVVNIDSMLAGWTRWHDKRPVEQDMGAIMDGFQPKKRSELNFLDEKEWSIDDRGIARDPWQFGNQCLMKNVKTGEPYTFTTTSRGGINAIGKLCSDASDYMREGHANEYPIIELNLDFYKHAQYGKIYLPVFNIVGWSDADDFGSEEKVVATSKAKKPKGGERSLTYR